MRSVLRGSDFAVRSKIDRVEGQANALATRARQLLRLTIEDLDVTAFTLEEISEQFNYRGKPGIDRGGNGKVVTSRFGESHLRFLLSRGLITFCPKTKSFAVTDAGMRQYELEGEEPDRDESDS